MEKVRRQGKFMQVEKRFVTITTVTPSLPATPVMETEKCTRAETKTVYRACPTYTCVPGCDLAQVVR
jgi:hypothetical protein